MNLLLDESIGLKEIDPDITSRITTKIKPMTFGKKNQQLTDLIESQKHKRLKKIINPQSHTKNEEIRFLMNFFNDTSTLYYLFDPKVTNQSTLQRIRQWLLPKYKLYYMEAPAHQAKTLYIIDRLTNYLMQYDSLNMPWKDISTQKEGRLFVITPKVKPFVKVGKQYRIFPDTKYGTYKLIERSEGKWNIHQVGQWGDLMNLVKAYQTDEEHCWMTYQGLNPLENKETLDRATTQKLGPHMFPGNLPHIQMYLSKTQTSNENLLKAVDSL